MKKNLVALGKCLMAFAGILAILGMFSFVSCSGDDDDDSGSTSKTEQKSDEKKGDEQKESSDTPSVDPSNPPSGEPSGSVEITFMANDGTDTKKTITLNATDYLPEAKVLSAEYVDINSACEYDRDGYSFQGWGKAKDTIADDCVSGTYIMELITAGTKTATLYAVWQKNEAPAASADLIEGCKVGDIVLADGTIVDSFGDYTYDAANPPVGIIAFSKWNNTQSGKKWYEEPHCKATSKKDIYMVSIFHADNLWAETDAEGTDKEIATVTASDLNYIVANEETGWEYKASFTGALDGSTFYDTLKSKVSDAEDAKKYPLIHYAMNYGKYHQNVSFATQFDTNYKLPESSAYYSGWYVPSVAELYAMYCNDSAMKNQTILNSLKKVAKAMKNISSSGQFQKNIDTVMWGYDNCFYLSNSSSDSSDGKSFLRFEVDSENYTAKITEVSKKDQRNSMGWSWLVHPLEN